MLFLLPIAGFVALVCLSLQQGRLSAWHGKCIEFCRQGSWNKLAALGENLCRIHKEDPETLFWGAYASNQLEDKPKTEYFAGMLLRQRHLNRAIESQTRQIYHPVQWRQRIQQYRVTAVDSILLTGFLMLSVSIFTKRNPLPWISFLSVVGCLMLFL